MDPLVRYWMEMALLAIVVLFLPDLIAFYRRQPKRWIIFKITVAFGATIVGWLIALIWSLHGFHRSEGSLEMVAGRA